MTAILAIQAMNRSRPRAPLLAGVLLCGLLVALPACRGTADPARGEGDGGGALPGCATDDALALGRCVEPERYQADLEAIAVPRPSGSANLDAIRERCADRLTKLGFDVEEHAYGTGVNVIGVRRGTDEAGPRVLLGAHYDSTPACPGADDNASGVAGAIEAARVLSTAEFPGTLVVACWDEEERGLIGSRAYAERARANGETIDAHFNFEMIGFTDVTPGAQALPNGLGTLFPEVVAEIEANDNRGDFIAVIADPASADAVEKLEHFAGLFDLPFIGMVVPAAYLDSPAIGDLRRSDHASFWDNGYPGMMLTDTSEFRYPGYHCREGRDEVGRLDQAFSVKVIRMTVSAVAASLGL